MADYERINLNDEKYKGFDVKMMKVRGEPKYEVMILDNRLGKQFKSDRGSSYLIIPATSKVIALSAIKTMIDKHIPDAQSWEKRKAMLEQKFNIQGLSRTSGGGYRYIFFNKGIHWTVKIESAGHTRIEYEEYPYSQKHENLQYGERSRSQGSVKYTFNAPLEMQITESIRRIEAYKEIKRNIGTFGIEPNKMNVDVREGERNQNYKGFDIKIKYLINEKERELGTQIFVYHNGKLVTTDTDRLGYYPNDFDETMNRQFDKAKDWIARKVIYNMTGDVGETDMNKSAEGMHKSNSWKGQGERELQTKAKNKYWGMAMLNKKRGW